MRSLRHKIGKMVCLLRLLEVSWVGWGGWESHKPFCYLSGWEWGFKKISDEMGGGGGGGGGGVVKIFET